MCRNRRPSPVIKARGPYEVSAYPIGDRRLAQKPGYKD